MSASEVVSYSSLLLHSRDVYCTFRTQYFIIRVGCLASASALASHIAGLVNIPGFSTLASSAYHSNGRRTRWCFKAIAIFTNYISHVLNINLINRLVQRSCIEKLVNF